jgi:hypothetical protein
MYKALKRLENLPPGKGATVAEIREMMTRLRGQPRRYPTEEELKQVIELANQIEGTLNE